jgi:hypothetical protein
MKKLLLLLPIAIFLTSCFEEDIAVTPLDRGDVQSNVAALEGPKYSNQVYYDLKSNTVVSTNKYGEWDLGFQAYDSLYIRLNSARVMAVQDLGIVDFASVTRESEEVEYRRDVPSGNTDSLAIGKWWTEKDGKIVSKEHVYIIDRNRSHDGTRGGLRKMKILSADEDKFTFIFAELNSEEIDTVVVPRDDRYNYITVSLDNNGSVTNLQPVSNEWDILFTRYTELFDVPGFEVYPVTGALINGRYCKVTEADSTISFEELTADYINEYSFSNKLDVIGYNWKQVDINTGVYTVNPLKKYIIQDNEGFYYKLRFIGFSKIVDGRSERGYMEFEIKLL